MIGKRRREAAAAEEARVQGVRDQASVIFGQIREAFAAAQESGDAQLQAVHKEIEAAETKARNLLSSIGYRFTQEMEDELRGMHKATWSARGRETNREVVRAAWKDLQGRSRSYVTTGTKSILSAYDRLGDDWYHGYVSELEIDRDRARDELAVELRALVDELWPRVMEDRSAWDTLRPLVADQWVKGERNAGLKFYAKMGIDIAVDSQVWNLATVYHNQNPSLVDFVGAYDPEMKEGALLLRAAEALRSRSFLEAKIVLAYCKYNHRWFVEAGTFREDLAEMVVEMEQMEMANSITYAMA